MNLYPHSQNIKRQKHYYFESMLKMQRSLQHVCLELSVVALRRRLSRDSCEARDDVAQAPAIGRERRRVGVVVVGGSPIVVVFVDVCARVSLRRSFGAMRRSTSFVLSISRRSRRACRRRRVRDIIDDGRRLLAQRCNRCIVAATKCGINEKVGSFFSVFLCVCARVCVCFLLKRRFDLCHVV
jgi:hypothetical protein